MPSSKGWIGLDGVPGLLNVAQGDGDRLAVENGRDLLLAEDVALDGQRAADRADAIDAAQTKVTRETGRFRATDRLRDPGDPGQYVRGEPERTLPLAAGPGSAGRPFRIPAI